MAGGGGGGWWVADGALFSKLGAKFKTSEAGTALITHGENIVRSNTGAHSRPYSSCKAKFWE